MTKPIDRAATKKLENILNESMRNSESREKYNTNDLHKKIVKDITLPVKKYMEWRKDRIKKAKKQMKPL